ncbi:uncharacterized protein [Palaemon carinicauda]|uniref:uncharacterized protein n=1 Tax=Palaemon carinicauda TaxID=392227 RepID=UPI0035B620E1
MSLEESETVGSDDFPEVSSVQDAMEDHTTTVATLAHHENKKEKEECSVCGSRAKSYHFGGLCCASCKAFFRRSIQSNSWEIFLCVNNGDCSMRENRRACQACRFELCKKIGMDPSLVMNIEDRKALMLRKLEKKKRLLLKNRMLREKQQQQQQQKEDCQDKSENVGQQESNIEWDSKVTNTEEGTELENHLEEVNDECLIIETLSQENQRKIEGLQKMLRKALTFPEFPKHYYEVDTDVTEHLFFVFCKAMGKFVSFVPEFQKLDNEDQGVLLKDAVVKSIFIFGAHQFQDDDECWPRRLLSPNCTFPTISLASTEKFIDDDYAFHRIRRFMRKFNRFFYDEVVTLLSLIIAVFDTEIPFINNTSKVAEFKEIYTKLLMNYLQCQNSSIAETLFTNELWNCLSEVKDLKEFFQKERSEDKDVKPFREKVQSSFSSSLHDLGEDPKMPPKKAFFERNKMSNSYHSHGMLPDEEQLKEQHNGKTITSNARQHDEHRIKDEEIMSFELPSNSYFRVAQDHNYPKANAMLPQTTLNDKYKSKLTEEEVQILACYGINGKRSRGNNEFISSGLKLQPKLKGVTLNKCKVINISDNYKERDDHGMSGEIDYRTGSLMQNKSPPLISPLLRMKGGASSGSTAMEVHHTSLNEIQIDSKVYCSRQAGFDRVHQQKFLSESLCKPKASEMPVVSANSEMFTGDPRHQHFLSSRDLSCNPLERAVPTLALKTVPIHLPMNNYFEMNGQTRSHCHPYTRHVNITSEMCTKHQFCSHTTGRDYLHNFKQSPTAFSCGLVQANQFNRQVPRQPQMINMCYNLDQRSTAGDQQLVKAAQSVLPPHLIKHIGSGQGEHL